MTCSSDPRCVAITQSERTTLRPASRVQIFSGVTRPTRGTLSGNVPNLVYKPAANFFGTDVLVFNVTDGKAISAQATINITVNSVNDIPVAVSKNVTTAEDLSLIHI